MKRPRYPYFFEKYTGYKNKTLNKFVDKNITVKAIIYRKKGNYHYTLC